MVEDRDEKRISLRVSPELYENISASARSKNLSINGFIIQALEIAVNPNSLESRLAAVEEKLRLLTN